MELLTQGVEVVDLVGTLLVEVMEMVLLEELAALVL
jgi:hypothetical protein